jgi:CRISPR-associated protein Cas2
MKFHWLISYDVRDAKRLRKVAKFLEGYGERLQYSLFTVYVTDRDLQKMKWEITKILDKEDSILYFKFCKNCEVKIKALNPEVKWISEEENYVIF